MKINPNKIAQQKSGAFNNNDKINKNIHATSEI